MRLNEVVNILTYHRPPDQILMKVISSFTIIHATHENKIVIKIQKINKRNYSQRMIQHFNLLIPSFVGPPEIVRRTIIRREIVPVNICSAKNCPASNCLCYRNCSASNFEIFREEIFSHVYILLLFCRLTISIINKYCAMGAVVKILTT